MQSRRERKKEKSEREKERKRDRQIKLGTRVDILKEGDEEKISSDIKRKKRELVRQTERG